jgi:AraC-like DNA-binding protein
MSEEQPPGSTRQTDEPPSSRSARRQLPARLWAAAALVSERLTAAAIDDVWARYDLGRIVHQIRYDPSGDLTARTLTNLARALGMHPSALRRYARVTERIAPCEFAELLQLRDRHGRPLSWSHFEKLAETPGADLRRRCANEVIAATLSVHQVAARLRALRGQRA